MAIAKNDLAKASEHLDRAIQLNGTILKGFIYKALLEKQQGHEKNAKQLFEEVRKRDAENVFTACTDFILNGYSDDIGKQIQKRYERDPDELLEVVATLYGAGFTKEAFQVVMLIDKTNPIIDLYRETLAEETGHALTQMVRKKTIANDFAWRLEEYFILKKKIREQPDRGVLYYHLGNFLFGHNFIEAGMSNWEKAKSLGYTDKVMLVSLYRAYMKLGNKEKAYDYLNEAYALDNRDPYIFDYYVSEIQDKKGIEEAIKLMEANYKDFPDCYALRTRLMSAYLNEGDYDKLEKLLKKSKLHDMHRVNYGNYWFSLKMARGYNHLKAGKYKEALKDFTVATEVPENIAQHFMAAYSSQARRLFYLGYCNKKLGEKDKARQYWEDALKRKRISRFEPGYRFDEIKTIYYQNFCLKALGRNDEARVYVMVIEDFANSFDNLNNDGLRKLSLMLSILGLSSPDEYEKWDTPLGLQHLKVEFTAPEE
jgi:tetratricopeptide (TPR) repeat protein